jgi:hypothetical protein
MVRMAASEPPRRWVLVRDLCPRRAVATGLIVALLTPACAVSRPGSTPPEIATAPSREECEEFAQKASAAVQGSSGGFVLGAPPRSNPGTYTYSQNTVTGTDAAILVAIYAGIFAVVGLAAAASTAFDNGRVREAAYTDATDACLRPGILSRELGPEHSEVARSLHALGYRYSRQAEFEKAESALRPGAGDPGAKPWSERSRARDDAG